MHFIGKHIFSGNFWWTTSKYVSKLSEIDLTSDYKTAETWIFGHNKARILSLHTSFGLASYLYSFPRYMYDGSHSKQIGILCDNSII
jgi:hypothetical protein